MEDKILKMKTDLRDMIYQEMEKQNVSQADLARMLKVDRRAVNNSLKTRFEHTSIKKLLEMLYALNVTINLSFFHTK